MNISDLKEGLKFKCKYMGEVKHGLIGVHRKGMDGECPILTIYDVPVSNSRIIHISVSPPKGQGLEYFLDDNKITDFEILPEYPIEVPYKPAQPYIKGDNNRIENCFFSFHKPVPTRHIVSLVFNNKGVQNTVDVVSANCVHEAIGAAIEKQMKSNTNLVCYNVMPWEVEEDKNGQ